MQKERNAFIGLILVLAALVAVPLLTLGVGVDTYTGATFTTLLAPSRVAGGASTTGTATSVATRQGIGTFVLAAGVGESGTFTNTVWIEHCGTSGGTYAPLTNSLGTAVRLQTVSNATPSVSAIKCDMGIVSQYVRAVQSSVTDTGTASAVLIAY